MAAGGTTSTGPSCGSDTDSDGVAGFAAARAGGAATRSSFWVILAAVAVGRLAPPNCGSSASASLRVMLSAWAKAS
ncbi:hypothetical protein AUC69_12840 [Methyloceanibacter superfactus]|uniref:Uncharacterized protein n=2 Tax=Methyloceanibacter superfactus TaxID=1774969 RepID=A0A1E3VUQ7_9HYPH|nr:hypothetical protein AUC69_12840 [Methyloceanibacter superfactus]